VDIFSNMHLIMRFSSNVTVLIGLIFFLTAFNCLRSIKQQELVEHARVHGGDVKARPIDRRINRRTAHARQSQSASKQLPDKQTSNQATKRITQQSMTYPGKQTAANRLRSFIRSCELCCVALTSKRRSGRSNKRTNKHTRSFVRSFIHLSLASPPHPHPPDRVVRGGGVASL